MPHLDLARAPEIRSGAFCVPPLQHGRLVQFPAQLKKRTIVLERIAQEFEPDHRYSEREVNQILVEFNDDVASLRRGMIDIGVMAREAGVYWRVR